RGFVLENLDFMFTWLKQGLKAVAKTYGQSMDIRGGNIRLNKDFEGRELGGGGSESSNIEDKLVYFALLDAVARAAVPNLWLLLGFLCLFDHMIFVGGFQIYYYKLSGPSHFGSSLPSPFLRRGAISRLRYIRTLIFSVDAGLGFGHMYKALRPKKQAF
ncbi:hypothetical protein ACJX0J_039641, partial [Zea mays]